MKIKKIILTILLFVSITAFAQDNPTSQLGKLLGNIKTYQANFEQYTYDTQSKLIQKSKGKVYMMRPGKFRWNTQRPTSQVLIVNGKTLWIYDIDLEQATKQQIQPGHEVNPASLLSGSFDKLSKRFTITTQMGRHGREFTLMPIKQGGSFQNIRLQFRGKYLFGMYVLNSIDQTSRFIFMNVKLNQALNPKIFKFKAPKGVDVFKQ